ncbi:MAG: PLP-dependent aminotransferase family protein, partial [Pseudomonadales bacterium]
EALDQELGVDAHMPGFGGSSLWVRGPEELDADRLKVAAMAEGIIIEPGAVHFIQNDPPRNFFRLGFSSVSDGKIAEGIQGLAALIPGAMSD